MFLLALVAVMILVSVGTMDWHSLHPATLRRMPASETAIMLVTVVVTVAFHNLAYGVISGVIVAILFFARRVAHFTEVVDVAHPDEDTRVYAVRGALFFAPSNDLVGQFDNVGDPQNLIIDLSDAQIHDSSTVAALDAIELKYHQKGKNVQVIGLNEPSQPGTPSSAASSAPATDNPARVGVGSLPWIPRRLSHPWPDRGKDSTRA